MLPTKAPAPLALTGVCLMGLLLQACATAPSARPLEPARAPADAQEAKGPTRLYTETLAAWQSGDLAAAEEGLRAQVQSHPYDSGPATNLGILLAKSGRSAEALVQFERAVQNNRRNGVAWNWLGSLRRAAGDAEAAERAYLSALAHAPDKVATHRNLAILYDLDLNRPLDAARHYRLYQQLSGDENRIVQAWILEAEARAEAFRIAELQP
ncbi:MAG: hypothetical protein ACPHCJ_05235 [Oceanococcaceae bacterium]